ncbi:MAG: hypothetical protein EOL86_09135, partial [Deltaproteobacteria bacterium]|nr:hypothetical protein [Deltaproteobacteria bacterium]
LPRRLAPEQGARPDTAHRSSKLRLPDRRTAPVSTAIMLYQHGSLSSANFSASFFVGKTISTKFETGKSVVNFLPSQKAALGKNPSCASQHISTGYHPT